MHAPRTGTHTRTHARARTHCASFGSRLFALFTLLLALISALCPSTSVWASLEVYSPHLHCCYLLCNIRVVSSHYMAISRNTVVGSAQYYCHYIKAGASVSYLPFHVILSAFSVAILDLLVNLFNPTRPPWVGLTLLFYPVLGPAEIWIGLSTLIMLLYIILTF